MSHRVSGVSRLFQTIRGRVARATRAEATARMRSAVASAVEPLEARTLMAVTPIEDPLFGRQWELQNTGQTAVQSDGEFGLTGVAGADIDALAAWSHLNATGKDVVPSDPLNQVIVAVLDTGLDLTHPDIVDNLFTNTLETPGNGIDDDLNGFIDDVHGWDFNDDDSDVTDGQGHGTHVAGTIGAAWNAEGIRGVAGNVVKILPVRVLNDQGGGKFPEDVVRGINYVSTLKAQGFNVVAMNASLGALLFPFPKSFANSVARAAELGITFVVAAGNDDEDVDRIQDFPSKFGANLPNTITVAATNNQDGLAFFSNNGTASVTVGAPGQAITSLWPLLEDNDNLDNDSDTFIDEADENADGLPDGYESISGTSMASPVVAGIVALLAAQKPTASVAQIRDALFAGVEHIPALQGTFSRANFVQSGGRVNAYNSLRAIENQIVTTDTVTRGNWVGNYGLQGAVIAGDSATFPSFVNNDDPAGIVTNSGSVVLNPLSTNVSSLQKLTAPTERIQAHFVSGTSVNLHLAFNDGLTHRVTFYAADSDTRGKREQTVIVYDNATSVAIAGTTMRNFKKGQYVTFDLTGDVVVQFTRTKGPSAILDGIFFDAPAIDERVFAGQDDTSRGNWKDRYGSQGAFVVGQSTLFPGFANVTPSGPLSQVVIDDTTTNARAPEKVGSDEHVAAYYATPTFMNFDFDFTDGQPHEVALYMVDFERLNRRQRVQVIDFDTGALLSQHDVSDFGNGKYLSFNLSGRKRIRVTNLSGPSAVVSGIFFDGAPGTNGRSIGIDTTTRGSWVGNYGSDGAYVAGDTVGFPDLVTASFTDGGHLRFFDRTTTNLGAPQRVLSTSDRVAAYNLGVSSMELDLDFDDESTHRVSFYSSEFDRRNRSQRFDVVDPETGEVLASETLTNFRNGKHVVFDLRGHVIVRITRIAGPNVVLSGVFFD